MRAFKEEQRFTQWWVWLILLSLLAMLLFAIVQKIIMGKPFEDDSMSDVSLILSTMIVSFFVLFFSKLKLKTEINETGISYSFTLFRKSKLITWNEIIYAEIIRYRPISEYGGWGMRHNTYTVKGSIGLQIKLKNGQKILIGTQKESDLTQVLEMYKDKINV